MIVNLRLKYFRTRIVTNTLFIIVCCLLLYVLIKKRHSILFANFNEIQNIAEIKQELYPEPGSFLRAQIPSNESYCKFNFKLPFELNYKKSDIFGSPQLDFEGIYRVLYNVVESHLNISGSTVTYCTHLTPHYFYYLAELLRHWDGIVSVAMFVPDVDADVTVHLLNNLCHCMPEMSRVSVHFVFPWFHPPTLYHECSNPSKCDPFDVTDLLTFRHRENIPYPVNVCRNVARRAAQTAHVLVSDVELIPSPYLATNFISMLAKTPRFPLKQQVFVVPVFEIEVGEMIPLTKQSLKQLYDKEKAVYFHRWVCQHCQRFPGLIRWLNRPGTNGVTPFLVARRQEPFHRWEPIYIGTDREPMYSETLSWEGKQDKMTQMVEMCLLGYKFVILDGAFMVHWPGIKRPSTQSKILNAWRKPHQRDNTKQYQVIINQLASKYTENEKCKL